MTAGNVFLADCPARLAVEIIADKWAVVILYGLADQPRRHGELARLIGGISNKVLTHTLRRLESSGLVARQAYAEAPPESNTSSQNSAVPLSTRSGCWLNGPRPTVTPSLTPKTVRDRIELVR